jgi:dTDP-4-dehydrorhamnose reductase
LVTGAAGALGSDLVDLLTAAGADVVGLDHAQFDLAAPVADLTGRLAEVAPTVVINAGAYTHVDDAETDEERAFAINARGPGVIATWCAMNRRRLIQVSTDYVFSGDAMSPYETTDRTGPTGAYGRTKLAGEQAVLAASGDAHVVRTGWLYGERGTSFIRTIGSRLHAGSEVAVVTDQIGAPTWTRALAERLITLGTADVPGGIWHCSAAGQASWYDVAVALGEELDVDPDLIGRTTSAAYVRPARRPAYSVLSNDAWIAAGLPAMTDWRTALSDALPSVL